MFKSITELYLLLDGGASALIYCFLIFDQSGLLGLFFADLFIIFFILTVCGLVLGLKFGAEEEEDFLYFLELVTEVVVDDNEGEDVAAIDYDDDPIEDRHNQKCLLEFIGPLFLYHHSQIGKDACELVREHSGVREILSQVIRDVVVLAIEIQCKSDLERISNGESGACVAAVGRGVVEHLQLLLA
jgi:hypothetical protein